MKRTTALLLLPLVLTGCRFLQQQRHAAANAVAAAVVRSLVHIQSSAPDVRRAPRPATLLTSLRAPGPGPAPVPARKPKQEPLMRCKLTFQRADAEKRAAL